MCLYCTKRADADSLKYIVFNLETGNGQSTVFLVLWGSLYLFQSMVDQSSVREVQLHGHLNA